MIIRHVPRWLHDEVTITASSTLRLPGSTFANTEVYPWRLKWLSVVGTPALGGAAPWNVNVGGVARRLRFEVGISQYGDINLVPANALTIMGHNGDWVQLENVMNPGMQYQFERPFPLPPDAGMVCEVQNLDVITGYDAVKPSILFSGFYRGQGTTRKPALLGGHGQDALTPGATEIIDMADLLNNGRDTMFLYEMIVGAASVLLDHVNFFPSGDHLAWRVNPSTGVPWMPRPRPIPSGCIAPFNRQHADMGDRGPHVYEFPTDTILQPRQRLGIKITELSGVAQVVHVCLHGTLEVS